MGRWADGDENSLVWPKASDAPRPEGRGGLPFIRHSLRAAAQHKASSVTRARSFITQSQPSISIILPSHTMALNGLAGAGHKKTQILESKGIFEEKATGEMQILGGIFNRKKSGSGTSTPTPMTKKPSVGDGDAISPVGGGESDKVKLEETARRQEKEKVAGLDAERKAIKAAGESLFHQPRTLDRCPSLSRPSSHFEADVLA